MSCMAPISLFSSRLGQWTGEVFPLPPLPFVGAIGVLASEIVGLSKGVQIVTNESMKGHFVVCSALPCCIASENICRMTRLCNPVERQLDQTGNHWSQNAMLDHVPDLVKVDSSLCCATDGFADRTSWRAARSSPNSGNKSVYRYIPITRNLCSLHGCRDKCSIAVARAAQQSQQILMQFVVREQQAIMRFHV